MSLGQLPLVAPDDFTQMLRQHYMTRNNANHRARGHENPQTDSPSLRQQLASRSTVCPGPGCWWGVELEELQQFSYSVLLHPSHRPKCSTQLSEILNRPSKPALTHTPDWCCVVLVNPSSSTWAGSSQESRDKNRLEPIYKETFWITKGKIWKSGKNFFTHSWKFIPEEPCRCEFVAFYQARNWYKLHLVRSCSLSSGPDGWFTLTKPVHMKYDLLLSDWLEICILWLGVYWRLCYLCALKQQHWGLQEMKNVMISWNNCSTPPALLWAAHNDLGQCSSLSACRNRTKDGCDFWWNFAQCWGSKRSIDIQPDEQQSPVLLTIMLT